MIIIRRVSWLYIVACTNGYHQDDKGDWLCRGLLHSFWQHKILVWNLVFVSPGGQFGHRYVIPKATRHIVQSSLRVQNGVSFFCKMQSARPVPFHPQAQWPSMLVCVYTHTHTHTHTQNKISRKHPILPNPTLTHQIITYFFMAHILEKSILYHSHDSIHSDHLTWSCLFGNRWGKRIGLEGYIA